jgi:dihydropteroate synthase
VSPAPGGGWQLRTRILPLDRPLLMGILNVTPDSFSDGGLAATPEQAVERATRLVADGADIVDVGGESTRPGAEPVPLEEELARVVPVVEQLAAVGLVVSIDTMKPEVARIALATGAEIVNDVGGMSDPDMRRIAGESGAGVVIVHMQGSPRTMQDDPRYVDVVAEVRDFLSQRVGWCLEAGVAPEAICVDPGIGFGKTVEHNLALIDELGELATLGYPVMLGASRKKFIGTLLGGREPSGRDIGSAAVSALAVERGAAVLRVHDPAASRDAAAVAAAMVSGRTRRRQR